MATNEQDQKDIQIGRLSREYTELIQGINALDKEIEGCLEKIKECANSLNLRGHLIDIMNSFEQHPYPEHSYISAKISERYTLSNKQARIASELNSLGVNPPSR